MIEPERFDLIGELAAAFPYVAIAERTIEVYAKDLSDIPLETLRSAIELCRHESRFFPTVPDLRERADAIKPRTREAPPDCPRCHGSGFEQYREGSYATARRCDHVTIDQDEDVSMF